MKLTHAALLVLLAAPVIAHAQDDAWEATLAARHQQLIDRNGPGTDAALRTQLLPLGAQDQRARGIVNGQPVDKTKLQIATNLAEIDRNLTAQLKAIVAAHGWPTIHTVGYDASNAAMLILIHTPDHAWQHTMVPQLEPLAAHDEIDGSQLATLVDKELIAEGKLQRYGTQFKSVDGQAMMFAVEDPTHLDARREAAMLPPMFAYKKQLADMYHIPISDMIIRPDAK